MDEPAQGKALAIVAGAGALPVEAARLLAARAPGLTVVAFDGLSDPALASVGRETRWLRLGQLEALARTLTALGARDLLLLGKVPKTLLFDDEGIVTLDAEALRLLGHESRRGDEPLMAAFAEWLEKHGHRCVDQSAWLAPLLVEAGVLGSHAASPDQLRDLASGRRAALALGEAGIGQCVAVKGGAILAVEAIEGTDAMIARAGSLGGAGATIVKVARPGQDRRFDLPAIGPGTIAAMQAVSATGLAVEAGSTLIVDRLRTIEAADRAGIAVWGFDPDAADAS